jgi:hypothetical protein
MILYHRTTEEAAAAILTGGFINHTDYYGGTRLHTGVWLSDQPLDINEGAQGDVLLEVAGLSETDIRHCEWIEDGKPYREWLIDAAIINTDATIRRVTSDLAVQAQESATSEE